MTKKDIQVKVIRFPREPWSAVPAFTPFIHLFQIDWLS